MEYGPNQYILNQALASMPDSNPESDSGFGLVSDAELDNQIAEPKMYKVLLLNDDYTPMDFVVYVLKNFFTLNEVTANQVMLDVHNKGSGVAGVYSFEVAETKSNAVNAFSKKNQYPLKSIIEEEN